ncbi:MAG: hypothetical protein K0U74_12165 [Alphaproteobacteria bacterium]|nr:hypothetical protein [Alphaproteobacteria bacterium]
MTNEKFDIDGDKLEDVEDAILEQLDHQRRIREGEEPDGWPEPPAEPVAVDPAVERQAFAELLELLAEDDGDADTQISKLSLDEFQQETFVTEEQS